MAYEREGRGVLMPGWEEQAEMAADAEEELAPAAGAWGSPGATKVRAGGRG